MIRTQPTSDEDRLVNQDPFSFLIAMLLDQQITIRWAFAGPNRIVDKLVQADLIDPDSSSIDPDLLVKLGSDRLVELLSSKPAIHRYPKVMARRIFELADEIVTTYSGKADAIWKHETQAQVVFKRLLGLPGFGAEKAQITLAVLAKRFKVDLSGWEKLSSPFDDDKPRTVADCGTLEDFEAMKLWKRQQKEQSLGKAD